MSEYTQTPSFHDQYSDAAVTTSAVPDDFVSDADAFPHHTLTAAEAQAEYEWAVEQGIVTPEPEMPLWELANNGRVTQVRARSSEAAIRKARRSGFAKGNRLPITATRLAGVA